jgi:hypothetical protein
MTPNGSFLKLPLKGPAEVGDEYCYTHSLSRFWLSAAVLVLLTAASFLLPNVYAPTPLAYVTVDINPSLELLVSVRQEVIAAEALNSEASHLLEGLKLKGKPIEQALNLILLAAADGGYLSGDNPLVVLASTPAGDSSAAGLDEMNEKLSEFTDQYMLEHAQPATVAVIAAGKELRDEAGELGLSTGKYAVYLQAQHDGLALDVQVLHDKGIGRSLLDLDAHPGEVLRRIGGKDNAANAPVNKKTGGDEPKAEEQDTSSGTGTGPGRVPATPPRETEKRSRSQRVTDAVYGRMRIR